MSKLRFSKGRFSRFMSSKGFYVALVVCLAGASVATWLAVDRTITGIERNNSEILERTQPSVPPLLEEAETKQSDIPQESAPPRAESSVSQPSSPTSSSSSEEQSERTETSAPSTQPETLPKLTYALPVRGDIIQQYSGGELIKNTTLGDWRTHDGMDIYAEKGADICAAADGTVRQIKSDPLWGTVVVIDHADGVESHYAGLHKTLAVAEGDSVTVRQAIGKLDGVPCEISDKSHLHFAMRRDGAWIDPMAIFAPES